MTERTLVAIPAFNEARSVGLVVEEALAHGHNVLVVDDGSTDTTADVARAGGARVIRLPINLGVGGARRCAYRFAVEHGYSSVVDCDADGQHPVAQIHNLIRIADELALDLLVGSRFVSTDAQLIEQRRLRRVAMWTLARSASRATGSIITDSTSGFRVVREPLLSVFAKRLPSYYLGDTYEAIVAAGRAGYRIGETAVEMNERWYGESTASARQAARFVLRAFLTGTLHLHEHLPRRP
ncbi:MAG: glycosyltransferase family 2 protein [Ilumatobacteraceae bacterium]